MVETPSVAKPPAQAASAPEVSQKVSTTGIKLNGGIIDLRGLSVEEGQKIYDALPPKYKAMADNYALIAKNYERAVKIKLPQGMNFGQAWKNFTEATSSGVNFASEQTAEYLKQFNAVFGEIPEVAALRKAARTASNAGSVRTGAGRAASDLVGAPGAIIDAGGVVLSEMFGPLSGGISAERARAFGAAFAGAALHESAVRQGMPLIANPLTGEKSLVFTYPGDAIAAGGEHVTTSWPIVSDVWAYFVAAGKLIMSYFSKDKALEGISFGERWAMALADSRKEQAGSKPEGTYAERLESRVAAGEIKRAAEKMGRAEVVAGLQMQEYGPLVTQDNVHVGHDGKTKVVEMGPDGLPNVSDLKDPKGAPVGRMDRILEAASGIAPGLQATAKSGNGYEVVGYVVGAGALAALEQTRLAPIRHFSNGVTHTLGFIITAPLDAAAGLVAGASKGTGLLAKILPSSAGPEKWKRANSDAVDAAGRAAESLALKKAKATGLEGEALKEMVERAREAARAEAAAQLKPRSAFSKAFDGMRSSGDAVRNFGVRADALAGSFSNLAHGVVDTAKGAVIFDTRTTARKTADAAAEAAKKVIDEAVEAAPPKLANPTIGERWASFKERVMNRGNANGSAQTVSASSQATNETAKKAVEKTAEEAAKAAELAAKAAEEGIKNASKVGVVFKIASGFGRLIPGVGAGVALTTVAFAGSAHADTVEGKKLSYSNQLDHDLKRGKVTDKEYAYYRGLQTVYVAAGAGGFITTGVTEAAQNGLEYADPVKMDKYLPESMVEMVKGLAGYKKQPAMTNEQLAAAHAGVVTQARMAMAPGRMATDKQGLANFNLGISNSSVRIGSVIEAQSTPAAGGNASISARTAAAQLVMPS